jgi:hypothetical protein
LNRTFYLPPLSHTHTIHQQGEEDEEEKEEEEEEVSGEAVEVSSRVELSEEYMAQLVRPRANKSKAKKIKKRKERR